MTTLELKALILQEIDKEQDPTVLEKLQTYYHKLKRCPKNLPTQYTLEELQNQLDKAENDVINNRITSHQELLTEIESW